MSEIAYLNGTYKEAMALLIEARNYIAYRHALPADAPPDARMRISFETMRVTARLTQVMAWLLAQKAVEMGEMTAAEAAADAYRLGGEEVCLDTAGSDMPELPPALKDISERSHAIYARVHRLDRMTAARAGQVH